MKLLVLKEFTLFLLTSVKNTLHTNWGAKNEHEDEVLMLYTTLNIIGNHALYETTHKPEKR